MKHFLMLWGILAGGAALAFGVDPAGLNNDERISMRIHQTSPIIYPRTLLARGITSGAARIAISLDMTGRLTDLLVVGYTHEEFAEAAEAALRDWSYEPMRVLGEHVATQATLVVNFSAQGAVVTLDPGTDLSRLLSFASGRGYEPCPLHRIDRFPAAIGFVEPVYPKSLAQHGVRGTAVLEFYIDENGSVRMPAVTGADFWELGVLAMEAVRQWRFERPTSKGRPVLVRVRQAFVFGGDSGL